MPALRAEPFAFGSRSHFAQQTLPNGRPRLHLRGREPVQFGIEPVADDELAHWVDGGRDTWTRARHREALRHQQEDRCLGILRAEGDSTHRALTTPESTSRR